ncbi:hypothetical protein LTR08_004743 [Meristemomyces frigidus]|nr:hypothetical protein LTR08_004743 [Meristemomyces frigidus]
MSVWFCWLGVKFGRESKSRVNGPCSPQAVGVAVADDAGNGFEGVDEVVILPTVVDNAYGEGVLELEVTVLNVELERRALLLGAEIDTCELVADGIEPVKLPVTPAATDEPEVVETEPANEDVTVALLLEVAGVEIAGTTFDEVVGAELERDAVNPEISLEIADTAAVEPLTGTGIDMLDGAGVIEGTEELWAPYGTSEDVGSPGAEVMLRPATGLTTALEDDGHGKVPEMLGAEEPVPGM